MPLDALPAEFLFTLSGPGGARVILEGAPSGTRVVTSVPEGTFEGPRLRGTVAGPSGDWNTRRPDGSGKLDVRTILLTEDGAAVIMTYYGIITFDTDRPVIRVAPLFETGDPRYAWLNNVQAVGLGSVKDGVITYDVYALK